MMCKLALLLSVEIFVLIAAIFLLVYVNRQQVSKWFTYSAVAIVITILMLMICSVCCAMCFRHCGPKGMKKECGMEEMRCNKRMMIRMHGGCPEEMMMREGSCSQGMEACEMKKECGEGEMKKECCEGKGGMMKKEIIIDTLQRKVK